MNIWFFVLATAVSGWVVGITGFLLTKDSDLAIRWAQWFYIMPLLITASLVVFSLSFPGGGNINRLRVYIVMGSFTVLSVWIIRDSTFLFNGTIEHSWGKEVVLRPVPYTLYGAYLVATFTLAMQTIYRKTKTEQGLLRSQASAFFIGSLVSCILGVFFNLVMPALGNYQLIWVGPLASTIYITTTAYGIIRHRMFDVQLVAARAVGYLFSMAVLAFVYGVLAFTVISLLFGEPDASVRERVVSTIIAVVLAVSFRPIKQFFDRVTNRLFYRDAYDPQVYIGHLNHILVSSVDLDELLSSVGRLIESTLKTDRCSFVLYTKPKHPPVVIGGHRAIHPRALDVMQQLMELRQGKIMQTDYLESKHRAQENVLQLAGVSLVGVIEGDRRGRQHHGWLGYLVLGPKKSGYPYGRQDRRVMELTVNELTIAIQNAMRFQEIENFNTTLQQKIDNATRKLRRTNDKLRALDETKDDFISMASHQLRTPLTSVKGYISMVLDGDAGRISPLQRKLLNQSFISAQRMVYLISDLLNVSRLRTGKFVIEMSPVNLSNLIKEEVDQLLETAKSRNLSLTYSRPDHFPDLMFDETKIRQVIMNFIDNAIYYTPSGGRISVSLVEKPSSIEFTVTDTGIGVPKTEQHHLFSKFYRAPNAKRARPDGTGLGLFMAKKVIVSQGGAIVFRSKEGQGSTFGFNFQKEKIAVRECGTLK